MSIHNICFDGGIRKITVLIQSNLNGSNIFGTIENCSRHGWFEPLRVNYGAK